jgi:cyclic beta-1,2-glucan synthetase
MEVVDDYPSSVLVHARRQHRWVRGDWQILLWLFPFVPTRTGLAWNRLSLISRWKILDNLRRSLVAPATVALFLAAWTYLPGSPATWTLAALAALAFSPLLWVVEILAGPRPWQPWGVLARDLVDDVKTALARASLQLAFVAYQACQMTHAIAITIARVAVTHRKMLEWQTAATVASQHGPAALTGTRLFVEQMLGSPLFAAVALVVVAVVYFHIYWPIALATAFALFVIFLVTLARRFHRGLGNTDIGYGLRSDHPLAPDDGHLLLGRAWPDVDGARQRPVRQARARRGRYPQHGGLHRLRRAAER